MRLLKPSWVTHDGHPIYSIDVHPDGSRFATGGQGADTGRIVIWNMSPVMNEDDEKDENVPKMLCQMDNHLACVNCVRWSSSGKYLASGGDDKVIMIWQTGRYGTGTSVFGTGGKTVNAEYWRCISTLRGHSGDVLDLAWSPHDAWLASCSVDNTVVIWNALKWQEIIAVLKGHTGLVKGVSWDPVGKYVASQSDDKSLRVWRTHDWQQETVLLEPFTECGGTTHVLRLSWSPDGQYLVSAHAMNNSGPTAQIIERDGWKTNKDFVGHRKAITCVRFNPNILSKVSKENGKAQCFCCCAIGSRDRSLSVWLTCLRRPLVVIHDLFSNSVLDVSWSQSGHQLVVCSWDGTVAYIDFSEEEIGIPLTVEEKGSYHQMMYGKSLAVANQNLSSTVAIIENPELLKLREQQEKEQQNELAAAAPVVNGISSSMKLTDSQSTQSSRTPAQMRGPTDKQIETRLPDGRRRITPLYIPPPPDLGDTPVPFSNRPTTFSSSSEAKTKIVIEKRDETNSLQSPINFKPCESAVATTTSNSAVTPRSVISNAQSLAKEVQPTPPLPSSAANRPTVVTQVPERDKPNDPKAVAVSALPGLDSAPIHIPVKKKADVTPTPGRPPEKRKPGRPPLAQTQSPAQVSSEKERQSEKTLSSYATFQLPVLKLDKSANIHIPGAKPESTTNVELENDVALGAGVVVHRLRCLSNGNAVWEVLLSSRGAALAGSKHVLCVACEDSTLSMFLPSGRRLLPPVVLTSPATRLTCSSHYVMVITNKGDVSVWNTREVRVLMNSESLVPLMQGTGTPQVTISSTALLDNGIPLITLSTGKSYTYHSEMRSWLLVSSIEDVLPQCSDHTTFLPSQNTFNGSILPLATLQSHHQKGLKISRSLFRSNPTLQQAGTLSHIDSQIAAAMSLQSGKEYKFWLLTLVRYVAQEGLESRAREVCDFLLGPGSQSCVGKWDSYILGHHKHDLLREILPIVGSNLKLQRLFAEYKDQLETK